MAAARDGEVEFHADGSVTLAGHELAADEVEIQATPRPGHRGRRRRRARGGHRHRADAELRAEGDARELARAIQDLRREAGLELDDRIELWLDGLRRRRRGRISPAVLRRHARRSEAAGAIAGRRAARGTVELDAGPVTHRLAAGRVTA